MRAWMGRDRKAVKALTSSDFRMVLGSNPAVLLDSKSWIDAATSRYRCMSYRFNEIYVHDLGSAVVFATQLDLQSTLDEQDWSGRIWITDIWRKSRVRRRWQIIERHMARPMETAEIGSAFRSLQLWR